MGSSIPLINGGFALVDPYDYDRLIRYPWRRNNKGYAMYAYTDPKGVRHEVYMHRWIMRPTRQEVVDHIDGNRLNNTRANLRVCSQQQNLRYRHCFRNNESGYNGVTQRGKRWLARIYCDEQAVRLGLYASAEEAALAYDCAARWLFGELPCSTSRIARRHPPSGTRCGSGCAPAPCASCNGCSWSRDEDSADAVLAPAEYRHG